MKANGAPEKIYLSQERDKDGCYIDLMWHKHPYEDMENIQYVRIDAFIEKAENFIYSALNNGIMGTANIEDFLRLFRNYMKGE